MALPLSQWEPQTGRGITIAILPENHLIFFIFHVLFNFEVMFLVKPQRNRIMASETNGAGEQRPAGRTAPVSGANGTGDPDSAGPSFLKLP